MLSFLSILMGLNLIKSRCMYATIINGTSIFRFVSSENDLKESNLRL